MYNEANLHTPSSFLIAHRCYTAFSSPIMLASFRPHETGKLVTSASRDLLLGSSPYASASALFNTSLWEEGVHDLLRTTNNPDTIRHICRLPFQDRNAPQVTLSGRWDPGLDSLLISVAAGAQYNEILEWTRDRKARELLRLLQPAVRRPAVWMWSWTPPNFASQDPCAIANNFHDIIYAEVHKVTFQEWVSYLHGHEEYAVTRLLCGVWNTREILHGRLTELFHREKNKFLEVEEVSLCYSTFYNKLLMNLTGTPLSTPSGTLDSRQQPTAQLCPTPRCPCLSLPFYHSPICK